MRRCSNRVAQPAITLLSAIVLLCYMDLPALAQDTSKGDHPPAHHTRLTIEEHFAQANLAHDGHLTLDEAKAGYPTVARHFQEIDVAAKGYVTENDLRAWHALQKAARRPRKEAANTMRPRNAFHLTYPARQPLNTSTDSVVAAPARTPPKAAAPAEP
jgi:hypothetical protein